MGFAPLFFTTWFVLSAILFFNKKSFIISFLGPFIPALLIGAIFSLQPSDEFKNNHDTPKVVKQDMSKVIKNEKKVLLDSYWGDFSKAKIVKKSGKTQLAVYPKWRQYIESIPEPLQAGVSSDYTVPSITYDEVWTAVDDFGYTAEEKIKYKGQLNISELYWNKGKVQAYALKEIFISDPTTHEKLIKPEYKITKVYTRKSILDQIN